MHEDEKDLLTSSDDEHESEPRKSVVGYVKVNNKSKASNAMRSSAKFIYLTGIVCYLLQT